MVIFQNFLIPTQKWRTQIETIIMKILPQKQRRVIEKQMQTLSAQIQIVLQKNTKR